VNNIFQISFDFWNKVIPSIHNQESKYSMEIFQERSIYFANAIISRSIESNVEILLSSKSFDSLQNLEEIESLPIPEKPQSQNQDLQFSDLFLNQSEQIKQNFSQENLTPKKVFNP
jgi:hypothetical protein